MELALNILGMVVCLALAFGVLRSASTHGRSYVACFAIILVCVSLVFPAISMTDDLAAGIVLSHDTGLPQLKFWLLALQLVLIAALLIAAILLPLSQFRLNLSKDLDCLPVCSGYRTSNSLRAPPAQFA